MKEISVELPRRLPDLAQRWRAGKIDAAQFAALYFLCWQIARHGQTFASRMDKNDPRPRAAEWLGVMERGEGEDLRRCLSGWLEHYQFHGVIRNVPVALAQWLRGAWPLIVREDVPTALEVLRMQARGYRAVTMLTEPVRLHAPVLNKPDAFAFFVHDLEHAYKFFHSPALRDGQCEFFTMLEAAFDRGVFAPYGDDTEFVARLHYLMSDMNTHPEHSRQYLRAILVEFYLRRERKGRQDALSPAAERMLNEVLCAVTAPAPRQACA